MIGNDTFMIVGAFAMFAEGISSAGTILLIGGAFALFMLAIAYIWQRSALSGMRRQTVPVPQSYPSLTVIRPIRGLDAGAKENVECALADPYPGEVETFFVFDDRREPALPLVEEAIENHARDPLPGQVARILYCGAPRGSRTGKLNAMIEGLHHANGEIIVFADSDVRQHPSSLKTLVDTLLSDPRSGSAFAPVVVAKPRRSAGDSAYALMLNGLYSPIAAAVSRARGGALPFIMGQFMAMRRSAIEKIGGLESAEGQLVDDMYLGQRMHENGLLNLMCARSVEIVQDGASLGDFVATLVRWIAFSRSGLPTLSFKVASWIPGTVFWFGLIGGASVFWGASSIVAWLFALPLAAGLIGNDLHVRMGGARLGLRYGWVVFALWTSAPLVYATIYARHEVTWRGRSYRLNAQSRLATSHKS